MWMNSMLREEYPHLLSFAILMAEAVYKQGSVTLVDLLFYMMPFVLTGGLFYLMRRIRSGKCQFFTAFIYYQIVQTFLLCRGYANGVNTFDLYASVILMVQHELTPLHSPVVNSLLIAKNTLAWTLILHDNNFDSLQLNTDYFMGVFWAFFHLFNYLNIRRGTLVSCFLSMKSLKREQQRLEALLQAIPDGVAVVTEKCEVVACNKSLLQQLQVAESSNQAGDIYEALQRLQYLPEYTESKASSGHLLTDILNFISRKNAKEDSFGVVTFSGVVYELRGRYSMWDQSSACVLIVRNITHWIDLERKAQRESASKTALLRSVSHELRTPTNVILNLARELQEHERLTQEGVLSLQMMTSSTSFLLSIINDLLDYSRIITGNFRLTKKVGGGSAVTLGRATVPLTASRP